jgi:hypothetical protein
VIDPCHFRVGAHFLCYEAPWVHPNAGYIEQNLRKWVWLNTMFALEVQEELCPKCTLLVTLCRANGLDFAADEENFKSVLKFRSALTKLLQQLGAEWRRPSNPAAERDWTTPGYAAFPIGEVPEVPCVEPRMWCPPAWRDDEEGSRIAVDHAKPFRNRKLRVGQVLQNVRSQHSPKAP